MIHTAMQLKAKIRNLSGNDSSKVQMLIRNYIMERFLERVSLSQYNHNFILKGGMLVAALIGIDSRATIDIDTTVNSINLSKENTIKIINEIISIEVPDGVQFSITKTVDIMEEFKYPGLRFILEATLDNIRQTIKLDISTDDVITPSAIEYSYKLMFENRTITLWTYNIETLLAEKLETILTRSTTNTRIKDFYDIYIISQQKTIDTNTMRKAFIATCKKRNVTYQITESKRILQTIKTDINMKNLWNQYQKSSYFISDLSWDEVIDSIINFTKTVI